MSTDNRRRALRLLTCVPVGVHTPEKARVGLIRDVNTGGALVFCKSKFSLKETLKLSIDTGEGGDPVEVTGQVVRVDRLKEGFWSYGIGLVFDPPREELSSVFQAMAARQERLFGGTV
ncbi:MAG: PilZ domain-containing protein [Myxococcaceae bacterium]